MKEEGECIHKLEAEVDELECWRKIRRCNICNGYDLMCHGYEIYHVKEEVVGDNFPILR